MIIKAYDPRYYNDVLNIFRQHVPDHFSSVEEKGLKHYLKNEIEDYFVVTVDDTPVAFGGINYLESGREARLSWDMVAPGYTGKGLGKALVEHRLSLIRGNPDVERIVVRTSGQAEGFYRAMGFRVDHRKKDYWAPGFDLCHMEIKI